MTLLIDCFRLPFMQKNPVLTLEAEDRLLLRNTKWTNGVDPTFHCKSEMFQGGIKRNIIGANTDKGIFS